MLCKKCGATIEPEHDFCLECGEPVQNELPPIENKRLKEIIKLLHEDYNNDIEDEFFKELNNASFLAPVDIQVDGDLRDKIDDNGEITIDKDTPMNFMLISSEDGKNFFPAFTDEEELAKDEVKQNAIIVQLSNYIEIMDKNPDEIHGIAINPFGEAIVIPKDRIIKK